MKWLSLASLILCFFLPSPSSAGTAFRMRIQAEPPTLDWNLAQEAISWQILGNLMEGLTELDQDLKIRPALAKSWTISKDGRTYTFHLREKARWSDGKP